MNRINKPSAIFENAIDSLIVGIKAYLSENKYSTRKHAILTIFHSIELLLKEYLYKINPILIYRNIDKTITDDSITAGVSEILARLSNLETPLKDEEKKVIQKIQKRRNLIEHHRYDYAEKDEEIIAESLRFIIYFIEFNLELKPSKHIDNNILIEIYEKIFRHEERDALANYRLEKWLMGKWPDRDIYKEDIPEEFRGTLRCPICRQEHLIDQDVDVPFCFYCNIDVQSEECKYCCGTKLISEKCCDPDMFT